MRIKKFSARSMPEALQMARAALGENAVILHSKSVAGKGLKGVFQSARVEVTAAADVVPPEDGGSSGGEVITRAVSGRPGGRSVLESLGRLEQRVAQLADRINESCQNNPPEPIPPKWMALYRALSEKGISLPVAQEILVRAAKTATDDSTHARVEAIRRAVEERFKTCGPLQLNGELPAVGVFVGPTGVGKTTTLAKIAAGFFQQGHRVALVTADTYRLAAVEQLRRFAEIMEVPVETVYEPRELAGALRRHRTAEVILMDTAGRSQNHTAQMNELAELLEPVRGAEIYLVLAATAAPATFRHQLHRFSTLGPKKVILTKVDELPCGGSLLDSVAACPLPIAYVTNGQEIPEDYWPTDPTRLARLVLSGRETGNTVGGIYARVG